MYQEFVDAAVSLGADKAVVIPGGKIAASPEFRKACEANACGYYGRCWMCPPDVGDIGALIKKVRSYPWALAYQSIHQLEDSLDIEGMTEASRRHSALSRAIERALASRLPGGYLHLICGGCHFCETCAKREGLPCRAPREARASLESHGIDVYHTVEGAGLNYINGADTVTYFSMILFGEGRDV